MRIEDVKDIAILDGCSPKLENNEPIPQVKRQLVIRPEKILDFKLSPHNDVEE